MPIRGVTTIGRKLEIQPEIAGSPTSWTVTWDELTTAMIAFLVPMLIGLLLLMGAKKTLLGLLLIAGGFVVAFLVARWRIRMRKAAKGRPSYWWDWLLKHGLVKGRRGYARFDGPVTVLGGRARQPVAEVFRSGAFQAGMDLAISGPMAADLAPLAGAYAPIITPTTRRLRVVGVAAEPMP